MSNKGADNHDHMTEETLETKSSFLFEQLKKSWKKEVRKQDRELSGFTKRLRLRYRDGFNLFRMLLTGARELGREQLEAINSISDRERYVLEDTILRLHTRACQVTAEILVLLENGYADGAMARWRTLHEIVAVSIFLSVAGDNAAERYIDHQCVEAYKSLMVYSKSYLDLGFQDFTERQKNKIKKDYEEVLGKWGDDFKGDYGWASVEIGKKNPKFSDIEEFVSKARLRPYYKLASSYVHAHSKALFFQLGVLEGENVYLAGATNYGFIEPAQNTAFALLDITNLIVERKATAEDKIILKTLELIVAGIPEAFKKSEQAVEEAHISLLKKK